MNNFSINLPTIIQNFSPLLLSHPMPKFRDDSECIKWALKYAIYVLEKKSKSGKIPGKKIKCLKLLNFIQDLYESVQKKEKDLQGKTTHKTQRPFYFINFDNGSSEYIFRRSAERGKRI